MYAGHTFIEVISLSGSAYVKATPPKLDRFSRNLVAKGIFRGGSSNNSGNAADHCHVGKSPIFILTRFNLLLYFYCTILQAQAGQGYHIRVLHYIGGVIIVKPLFKSVHPIMNIVKVDLVRTACLQDQNMEISHIYGHHLR